jgi:hypothetical protein
MKTDNLSRRKFIVSTSAGAAGALLSNPVPVFGSMKGGAASELAIKGGEPVRTEGWLDWPVWNSDAEEPMLSLLRSARSLRRNMPN